MIKKNAEHMFISNKYYRLYLRLIEVAQSKNRKKKTGIYEYDSHHIIPKCLGGSNRRDNLVLLTPREHYMAHMLLVRCTSEHIVNRMVSALVRFTSYAKTSRKYELFRSTVSTFSTGAKNRAFGKMWCYDKVDHSKVFFIDKSLFNPLTMNKGIPYQRGGNHNTKWMKKGDQQKSVPTTEVGKYLKLGWEFGRNTKMGIEHMKKMANVRHSPEKDKAHSEKMKKYHMENPRPPKAWINNGHMNKLIALAELYLYTDTGWKRGRM